MCPSFITGPFAVTSVSLENELMHHKIMTPAAQRHTRTHTQALGEVIPAHSVCSPPFTHSQERGNNDTRTLLKDACLGKGGWGVLVARAHHKGKQPHVSTSSGEEIRTGPLRGSRSSVHVVILAKPPLL